MKRYSVRVDKAHVMSVYANSEEEAREKARDQLGNPGRGMIGKKWRDAGEQVVEMRVIDAC